MLIPMVHRGARL